MGPTLRAKSCSFGGKNEEDRRFFMFTFYSPFVAVPLYECYSERTVHCTAVQEQIAGLATGKTEGGDSTSTSTEVPEVDYVRFMYDI
jgi:hypothetical protein